MLSIYSKYLLRCDSKQPEPKSMTLMALLPFCRNNIFSGFISQCIIFSLYKTRMHCNIE